MALNFIAQIALAAVVRCALLLLALIALAGLLGARRIVRLESQVTDLSADTCKASMSRDCPAAEATHEIGCSESELVARASLGLIRGCRLDRYGWHFPFAVVRRLAVEGLPRDPGADWRVSA